MTAQSAFLNNSENLVNRRVNNQEDIKCYQATLMSQSIPTGYIPPGNPWENFVERANPGRPSKIFCLIPAPRAKNDGRIPGGGAKFSQT